MLILLLFFLSCNIMESIILDAIQKNIDKIPLWIAIHGPQGCGKSTLCQNIKCHLEKHNISVCTLSLDDFYYSYQNMQAFIQKQNHPLYKHRGLAGTHDLTELFHCLDELKCGRLTSVPSFDKTKHDGRGDIVYYNIPTIKYDVVLFEGWLIGYKPLNHPPTILNEFNEHLKLYQKLQTYFTEWFYIEPENIDYIYNWRKSAEKTMNDNDFNEFMKSYMYVYQHYTLEHILHQKFTLDQNRNIVTI